MHAGDEIQSQQDDTADTKGVGESCDRVGELVSDLDEVPVDPAAGNDGYAIEVSDVVSGEDTGEEVPDDASNAMDAEDVETGGCQKKKYGDREGKAAYLSSMCM